MNNSGRGAEQPWGRIEVFVGPRHGFTSITAESASDALVKMQSLVDLAVRNRAAYITFDLRSRDAIASEGTCELLRFTYHGGAFDPIRNGLLRRFSGVERPPPIRVTIELAGSA